MADEVVDLTPILLREIRDSIVAVGADLGKRIDQTNERLDQTNARLDQTIGRLDLTNARLDLAVGRLDGLEASHHELRADMRRNHLQVAGVMVDMAGDISHIKDRLIGQEVLEGRVDRLEGEVASIKAQLAGSR